jgi:RimJ/RimL family protein N-acetyltransferase
MSDARAQHGVVALSPTPVLTTGRLTLRAPTAADWPAWRLFAMSDRAQYIGGPFSEASAWRAFGNAVGMWVLRGYGSFVFTERGSDLALGMAGPWHQIESPEREIGWSLWSLAAEGKGFAFEAASRARAYAFDVLGWDTAVSYIDCANTRSVALAHRLGAVEDRQAAMPGDTPCHVFRHPRHEVRA